MRYMRGDGGSVPFVLGVHLVAARYGQTPAAVRDWPAQDYTTAVGLLEATGLSSSRLVE